MKTVGERIRQARTVRGLSGEQLALDVGYKNQSAISNLENRATGTGGTKLPQIAKRLRVPLQWLADGPDSDDVPYAEPLIGAGITDAKYSTDSHDELSAYREDASMGEAMQLFRQLDTAQRLKVISYMQFIASEGQRASETGAGDRDPVPHPKAA